MRTVESNLGQKRIVIVASGDPLFYGVARYLCDRLGKDQDEPTPLLLVALNRAEAEAKSLKARLERQQADIAVAERQVDYWKQQLDDTIIRAPFAGIVTTKDAPL